MIELSSAHRAYLRRLAHDLPHVVQIGGKGVTANTFTNVDQALTGEELIKIKFIGGHDDKEGAAHDIAEATQSALVGSIGNVVLLYRPFDDPEKRLIELPVPTLRPTARRR